MVGSSRRLFGIEGNLYATPGCRDVTAGTSDRHGDTRDPFRELLLHLGVKRSEFRERILDSENVHTATSSSTPPWPFIVRREDLFAEKPLRGILRQEGFDLWLDGFSPHPTSPGSGGVHQRPKPHEHRDRSGV
jgi:hypothetical protein